MSENTPFILAILVLLALGQCTRDQQHQEMMDKLHQIELKLNK